MMQLNLPEENKAQSPSFQQSYFKRRVFPILRTGLIMKTDQALEVRES